VSGGRFKGTANQATFCQHKLSKELVHPIREVRLGLSCKSQNKIYVPVFHRNITYSILGTQAIHNIHYDSLGTEDEPIGTLSSKSDL